MPHTLASMETFIHRLALIHLDGPAGTLATVTVVTFGILAVAGLLSFKLDLAFLGFMCAFMAIIGGAYPIGQYDIEGTVTETIPADMSDTGQQVAKLGQPGVWVAFTDDTTPTVDDRINIRCVKPDPRGGATHQYDCRTYPDTETSHSPTATTASYPATSTTQAVTAAPDTPRECLITAGGDVSLADCFGQ